MLPKILAGLPSATRSWLESLLDVGRRFREGCLFFRVPCLVGFKGKPKVSQPPLGLPLKRTHPSAEQVRVPHGSCSQAMRPNTGFDP